MPARAQSWFRFTKSTLTTKNGRKVAVCFNMRRIERGPEDFFFRCKGCGWTFESEQKLPLEVRLHLQLHYPDNRWRARYATTPPDGEHCPSCGFSQTSWALLPEGVEEA